MIKVVIWILFLAFTGYALFCSFLYLTQRSLLYYPTPPALPADGDILVLENEGHRLRIQLAHQVFPESAHLFWRQCRKCCVQRS